MKRIVVAGVPEHFNLPWHLAIDEGAFEERGIDLEFIEVPEGTGRMCSMLREGETDMAIVLTEGIIKDISQGNPSTIIRTYVDSPLYWGIHVDAHSNIKTIKDLEGKTAAISRFGSGSHLMAFVHADTQGWDVNQLQFREVQNVNGAIEALGSGAADYFMWEHYTTKPYVDNGVFRRLGDCPTPWPCFVIAIRKETLKKEPAVVRHILEVLDVFTSEFKHIPSIDRMLANRYGQELEDIREWLSITRWSQENIDPVTIKAVQHQLLKLGIIDRALPFDELVTKV